MTTFIPPPPEPPPPPEHRIQCGACRYTAPASVFRVTHKVCPVKTTLTAIIWMIGIVLGGSVVLAIIGT